MLCVLCFRFEMVTFAVPGFTEHNHFRPRATAMLTLVRIKQHVLVYLAAASVVGSLASSSPAATRADASVLPQILQTPSHAASCGRQYPLQRPNATPYILGGDPLLCKSCRDGDISNFCRFQQPTALGQSHFQHPAHLCSAGKQAELGQLLQTLGLGAVLSFTPCQLWPQLQGRTLWIVGDSQVPLPDLHGFLHRTQQMWTSRHSHLPDLKANTPEHKPASMDMHNMGTHSAGSMPDLTAAS